jgi:6,7-dimethyl-8-ribityllumazine synthase
LNGEGLRFAIVYSRFNEEITDQLVSGARMGLGANGVEETSIEAFEVPGAFEIPLVAKRACETGRFDAVITLGAVIRGDTGHYELVAREAAAGITRAALDSGVPVVFGVLATETLEQAQDRSGGRLGNRGEDAALVAIEMALMHRELSTAAVS